MFLSLENSSTDFFIFVITFTTSPFDLGISAKLENSDAMEDKCSICSIRLFENLFKYSSQLGDLSSHAF